MLGGMDEPEEFDFHANDPDWDHVPPELREQDGKPVYLVTKNGELSGTLILYPEDLAVAARAREDDG
jgi:hypothetical protein